MTDTNASGLLGDETRTFIFSVDHTHGSNTKLLDFHPRLLLGQKPVALLIQNTMLRILVRTQINWTWSLLTLQERFNDSTIPRLLVYPLPIGMQCLMPHDACTCATNSSLKPLSHSAFSIFGETNKLFPSIVPGTEHGIHRIHSTSRKSGNQKHVIDSFDFYFIPGV